jgi:uncharacterized membrane protein
MKTIIRIFLGIFLVLGIGYFILFDYARFSFYWHDETFILQHLSGRTRPELVTTLYDGKVKSRSELQKFQGVNQDKGLVDTLKSLANTSADQPPFYFVLLWYWSKLFGNQERSLLVLAFGIWLGFLVSLYQLNLTLFNSRVTTLVTTFIIAISPRFFGLANDVREYGLFTLLTVLSSLLLLKSFQFSRQPRRWVLYGFSLAAGLSTHIFFIFVAIAQLIYFFVNDYFTNYHSKKGFTISYIAAWLTFLPWIVILILRKTEIYSWAKRPLSFSALLTRWLSTFPILSLLGNDILNYLFLVGLVISIYLIWKRLEKKYSSYLILFTVVPFASLAIVDLILATKYSSVGRFYIPSLLGASICFGYLISLGIEQKNKIISRVTALFIMVMTITFLRGISSPKQPVTYQGYGSVTVNSYTFIQQSKTPLVVGETWFDLFPLSYKVPENTRYLFVNSSTPLPTVELLDDYSNVYLINPSAGLKKSLEKQEMQILPTTNPSLFYLIH